MLGILAEVSAGAALAWALPLAVALAAVGSAFGLGKAVTAAMEAMGRQPEAAGRIQTGLIIGCAFIEALTIYALLTVILLMGKVPAVAAAAGG